MATAVLITHSLSRLKDTIDAVHFLRDQRLENKEIIVVVDRNHDLSTRLRNSLPDDVDVELSQEIGASGARNMGARLAKGDIVAFIDDDVVVSENWLPALVRNFRDTNVIGVGGRIEPMWTNGNSKVFPEELYWLIGCTYLGHPEKKHQARNVFGGNFAFRREVFKRVSFPQVFQRTENSFRGTEDTQFCINVLQTFRGSSIIYDPEVVAYHRVYAYRTSSRYLLQRAFSEGFSKAYFSRLPAAGNMQQRLAVEYTYLTHLITKLLPRRLRRILRSENPVLEVKHIVQIFLVVLAVAMGYSVGRCSHFNSGET